MTTIFTLWARMPRATSRSPMTSLRRARAFLSSFDRSCSRINSPSMEIKVGRAFSFGILVAYARGTPGLGILGTRLQAAYPSGMTFSPEYIGGGGGCGISLLLLLFSVSSFVRPSSVLFLASDDATDANIVAPPTTIPFSSCAARRATSCPSRYNTVTLPLWSPDTSALTLPIFPYSKAMFLMSSMLSCRQSSSSKSSSLRTFVKITSPALESSRSCSGKSRSALTKILEPPTMIPFSCCSAFSAEHWSPYTMYTFPLSSPDVAARAPSTGPYCRANPFMSSMLSSRASSSS
mmetsp:Transcript_31455/g.67031  ORF Transcript_31455/g.67031 Transcript_31455/m.67031 type:complete len:292 (-) Transcript_31455:473-1348(-)